jgi:hypothetical protein
VGQSLLRESGQDEVTTHGHRRALAVLRFGTRAMAKRADRRAQERGICVTAIRLSPATALDHDITSVIKAFCARYA